MVNNMLRVYWVLYGSRGGIEIEIVDKEETVVSQERLVAGN